MLGVISCSIGAKIYTRKKKRVVKYFLVYRIYAECNQSVKLTRIGFLHYNNRLQNEIFEFSECRNFGGTVKIYVRFFSKLKK